MLLSLLSQLSFSYLLIIFLYLIIAYILLQMLQQRSLIHFLGYKTLLIIYAGGCLAAHNLDILALVLGIVYGSFLVVFFIFSFLWLDSKQPLALYQATPQQQSALTGTFIVVAVCCGAAHAQVELTNTFLIQGIAYSELLYLHNSEELESLGWAFSTDLVSTTLVASILLTVSCLTAVVVLINTKKQKGIFLKKFLQQHIGQTNLMSTAVRRQNYFQQESRTLSKLQRVTPYFHGRRA